MAIRIIVPDSELIRQAAELKASRSVSCANCFVAATAMWFEAVILTGDSEFRKLESLVRVEWL